MSGQTTISGNKKSKKKKKNGVQLISEVRNGYDGREFICLICFFFLFYVLYLETIYMNYTRNIKVNDEFSVVRKFIAFCH